MELPPFSFPPTSLTIYLDGCWTAKSTTRRRTNPATTADRYKSAGYRIFRRRTRTIWDSARAAVHRSVRPAAAIYRPISAAILRRSNCSAAAVCRPISAAILHRPLTATVYRPISAAACRSISATVPRPLPIPDLCHRPIPTTDLRL